MARAVARLAAAWRDRRGISAIEFGVTVPAIVVIILGTFDLGNLIQQKMKLDEAVHAGGIYAMSFPINTSDIQGTVTAALPTGWTDVVVGSPTTTCACWSAGGETAADCTVTPVCTGGAVTERFITVTATKPFTPLLLIGLANSVSATYVARIQ